MIYNKKEKTIKGKNIYVDKKARNIYYVKSADKGYVITPGTEANLYNSSQRFVLGFIGGVLLHITLINNLFITVPFGLGIYALMEFRYRKLLNMYPMIQSPDLTKYKLSLDVVASESFNRTLFRCALLILLAVLFIVNIYTNSTIEADLAMTVISYLASFGALFIAIKQFVVALKEKKKH